MPRPSPARTALLTALATLGFVTNSVLCRIALETGSIDPVSFLSVRLAASR